MTYRLMDGIEFIKSLPDHSVDGIFTDPPWLIKNKNGNRDKRFSKSRAPRFRNQERWEDLLTEMTDEAARVLKADVGRCFIWLGMTSVARALKAINSLEYRFMFFCYYVPPRYIAGFECSVDPIIYLAPKSAHWPSAKRGQRRIRTLYQHCSTGSKDTMHPCARPFKSVKDILRDLFEEGEYVIDPFAGSDTTGRAARELNLKWDSCEIDPEMYKTGLVRHSQGILF